MSSTLRAAHKNFTPMDFYSTGVFFVLNFAHAITGETVVAVFFDILIHRYILSLRAKRRVSGTSTWMYTTSFVASSSG